MAEKKPLKKDLRDAIKEMSKGPGGASTMPRPVLPGGIQGGPPTITSPVIGAIQKQPEGPLVKRDIARETFRGFKTGEVKPEVLPSPKPNTRAVEVTKVKPTGKKGFKGTEEQKNVAQAVRGGTIGGMTRAPGSKPSLATSLPMAIEIAAGRAARRAEVDAIQESLRIPMGRIVSREEQKIIDRAAQAARDALMDRDAAIREATMLRDIDTGEVNPLAERIMQSEADRRIAVEIDKADRKIAKRIAETLKTTGKGTAAFGVVGLAVDAISLWRQLIREAELTNQQIQSETMN